MNRLEGKVILVTGANGFVGRHLVAKLSKITNIKLFVLSRQEQVSTQENIVWLKGSLEELTPQYWRDVKVNHIDFVFHLGAFTPKTSAESNQIDSITSDNILGTHVMLQGLPQGLVKIIYSSTLDVYAQPENDEVLTEESKVLPNTLYGASKLFCESLVSTWAKERGCNYSILRYGHIYGPGEDKYGKIIPVVIRNLLANQPPIVHGDGSALRDYFYVDDAVEATIRGALVDGNVGPVNIVRGESVALKEVVLILIRLVGNNTYINLIPDKPNGISLRFDNAKMTELLGNWPMTNLEVGLAAEVEAFRRMTNERQ